MWGDRGARDNLAVSFPFLDWQTPNHSRLSSKVISYVKPSTLFSSPPPPKSLREKESSPHSESPQDVVVVRLIRVLVKLCGNYFHNLSTQ